MPAVEEGDCSGPRGSLYRNSGSRKAQVSGEQGGQCGIPWLYGQGRRMGKVLNLNQSR